MRRRELIVLLVFTAVLVNSHICLAAKAGAKCLSFYPGGIEMGFVGGDIDLSVNDFGRFLLEHYQEVSLKLDKSFIPREESGGFSKMIYGQPARMICAMEVTFNDGSKKKIFTVSGDSAINNYPPDLDLVTPRNQLEFTTPQGYTFENHGGQLRSDNVMNLLSGRLEGVKYTQSCAAQKALWSISKHIEINPQLTVQRIVMVEKRVKFEEKIVSSPQRSCDKCDKTIPLAFPFTRSSRRA